MIQNWDRVRIKTEDNLVIGILENIAFYNRGNGGEIIIPEKGVIPAVLTVNIEYSFVSGINGRKQIRSAEIVEIEEVLKAGIRVELLENTINFREGDIAYIISDRGPDQDFNLRYQIVDLDNPTRAEIVQKNVFKAMDIDAYFKIMY